MRYLLSLLLLLTLPLHAEDRLQAEGYLLENGLQVLLKPTAQRGHVSIRLVVGVGFDDFSCADQELPHLLEHLFFSGLDGGDEAELETRMQALGGEWNAFTGESDTAYLIEAPAERQRQALDLLLDVLQRTRLTDANVAEVKRIVQRESGGHYSHLERWLDRQDLVGREAHQQLAVELGLACAERPQVASLGRDRLEALRHDWYVPNNMTLILVGDLDPLLPAHIERRFSDLVEGPQMERRALPHVRHQAAPRRTLRQGLFGESAKLHWIFREPALDSADNPTWELLRDYLEWALYRRLRIERGLSYGPWSERRAYGEESFISLNADLERGDVGRAERVMAELLDELRRDGLDPATFERLKAAAVARQAWAIQGDSDLADHYWYALGDFEDGRFGDDKARLGAVSLDQANRAIQRLLERPGYLRIEKPWLGFTSLYGLAGGLSLVILMGLALGLRARLRRANRG
ncbi:pitrilysin family protein [Pseudomonas sp. RIT-PI-AD]|uniref:M16 family metallopeptidase n=1 Tax=Pseudomonas sp. RIT-PI-AD TaxID=3035294 RepID=UPI0021DA39F6|nr:pitrilysin family protein [Pseudomonas sp. RIT-PI-AD]